MAVPSDASCQPWLSSGTSDVLLVVAIIVPVTGILLALMLGGRFLNRIAIVILPVGLAVAAAFCLPSAAAVKPSSISSAAGPPRSALLCAPMVSAAMMMTTAIVVCATALYARTEFSQPDGLPERRALVFWMC